MTRFFFILILFHLLYVPCIATPLGIDQKTIEQELRETLKKAISFDNQRLKKINNLKHKINKSKLDPSLQYELYYSLFTNYKNYQTDSAIKYLYLCQSVLPREKPDYKLSLDLDFSSLYAINGNYIKAIEILNTISHQQVPSNLKVKYFETLSDFYSRYGQSNQEEIYYQISEKYRDSLLLVLPINSIKYKITKATKNLYAGKIETAKQELQSLLKLDNNLDDDSISNKALITYLLGLAAKFEHHIEEQKYYFSLSVISDIQLANKDNASIQGLALTYYELGDIDIAFHLIDKAIQDAIACNVRYRIIEGTSFYPIINAAYQHQISIQHKKIVVSLIFISILTIILILGLVIIIKQIKKLKAIKKELSFRNKQLIELNEAILQSNNKLTEVNHIKEEYIAQFFDMCSNYIEKMDNNRKKLLKDASSKRYDFLITQLKSTQIVEEEVTELYKNFDTIFLNLYPSFVEDLNSLLRPDEALFPKKGELLNIELRIFALIRLGIDDSVKIASFLRYSLRTVYNYRTKVRNKASVNREEFEILVKNIGKIDR